MSSDTFHFDIAGAPLKESLEIAFLGSPSKKATHWKVEERLGEYPRFLLAWSPNTGKDFNPFPGALGTEELIGIIRHWLVDADYGREPDHDGDNRKGWRVYNESWAHIGTNHYVFAAIEPHWNVYGK